MKIIQIVLLHGLVLFVNCELFTLMGIGLAAGIASFNFDKIKKNTFCKLSECCTADFIPKSDLRASLTNTFKEQLFGQHIVQIKIPLALMNHYKNIESSKKPLVISFHGTPGTGKNFVSNMIIESVYPEGLKSSFVHRYIGSTDFPDNSKTLQYKEKLKNEIMNSVRRCPLSMFVFDEVDKMPKGLFDSIAAFVRSTYHMVLKPI